MPDVQLTLTTEERDLLVGLLERVMKEALVEEHRTESSAFRERIVKREHLISSIIGKLGSASR